MKTLIHDAVGEKRIALCDEKGPYQIIIKRDLCLNYGDIIDAKIGPYMSALHGYFAETDKGSVFLPIKNIYTEGQTVRVQISKEPRDGKVATGTLEIQENSDFQGSDISAQEMDELIAGAMDSNIPFAKGGYLHIEHTKVCWTIDVDTGNSPLGIDDINFEAIGQIARQITLKNMGGLILIDFAGSKRTPYCVHLEKAIKSSCQSDNLLRLCGWTKAGLYELERKRTQSDLWNSCGDENPYAIYYRVRRAIQATKSGKIAVRVAPIVLGLLQQAHISSEPLFNSPISYFEVKEL